MSHADEGDSPLYEAWKADPERYDYLLRGTQRFDDNAPEPWERSANEDEQHDYHGGAAGSFAAEGCSKCADEDDR